MIKNRTYTGTDGKDHQANDIDRFLDPDYEIKPIQAKPKNDFVDVTDEQDADLPW